MNPHSLLVGNSGLIIRLRAQCPLLAAWQRPKALIGPTGSGKSLVAQEIARHLPPNVPFQRISVAGLDHGLLDSELFGHVKGAYTGADRDRAGLLAAADGGIVFLDDFQDAPPKLQADALDAVEGKPVRPLGSDSAVRLNVQVMVGSQVPLERLWKAKRLREDLYERLNGVTVEVPTLAQRREDIRLLCGHLLARLAESLGRPVAAIEDEVVGLLEARAWPRNVRQLERVLELAAFEAYAESPQEPVIERRHLPRGFPGVGRRKRSSVPAGLVISAVERAGTRKRAAKELGVSPRTVYRRIQEVRKRRRSS